MAVYVDMASAQFENVNSLRDYPFAEGSSLVDRYGRELSRDVVVDLHMVVPGIEMQPNVKLTGVHLSPYMVSVCFTAFAVEVSALSVTVTRENFRPYTPFQMDKLAGSVDIGGFVTFGDIQFPGVHETYFFDNADVHPCCFAEHDPAHLRRFVDPRSGESLSGDARIDFSGYIEAARNGRTVTLSLADGAEGMLASECAAVTGPEACGATPISSINGVRPDADGNIVLWFH